MMINLIIVYLLLINHTLWTLLKSPRRNAVCSQTKHINTHSGDDIDEKDPKVIDHDIDHNLLSIKYMKSKPLSIEITETHHDDDHHQLQF